ncbi:MAG: hypothetical protein AB8G95_00585 [Anaerolineae bacterium]
MSKKVTVLHYYLSSQPDEPEIITLLGQPLEIEHVNCNGSLTEMLSRIQAIDSQTHAVALTGVTETLRLGNRSVVYEPAKELFEAAADSLVPALDGSVLLPALERWSIRMAHQKEPGIWAHKRVLMVPSLNHTGLAEALGHHAASLQSADSLIFAKQADTSLAGILSERKSVQKGDSALLAKLKTASPERLYSFTNPANQSAATRASLKKLFEWADVLAGDIQTISQFAPDQLERKTVVVPSIDKDQVDELIKRGVSIVVTVSPNLSHAKNELARHHPATLAACLTAVADTDSKRLGENDFLNLLAEIDWQPAIRYLQPEDVAVNRFGYITQPRNVAEIRKNVTVARFLPKAFIHRTAVHIPAVFRGRMEQIKAGGSRKSAVAEIMMLGGTPEEFTAQEAELVERRLLRAVSMAERLEARLIGVDAASREVSNAISSIAPKTNVPICTGQALTIYGALARGVEIATANSIRPESRSSQLKAAVINAADPIARVAAEVLAGLVAEISLIGSEPDLLIGLKRQIEDIHADTKVAIATHANQSVHHSDLIVLGRNAAGKRMTFNPDICNPGAVICDFSQPSVITPELLANRPDLTLVESAVFRLSDMPAGETCGALPHGLVTAPFAEAALLAIQGKFVDYGLAGALNSKHVYDIRDLALKGKTSLAGILAHGDLVPAATLEHRKELALRFDQSVDRVGSNERPKEAMFLEQPARPSIRRFAREHSSVVVAGVGVFALLAGTIGWFFRKKKEP